MSTVTVQVHRSPRLNALIVPDKQGGSSTLKRSDGGSGTPVVFGFPVKGSRSFQLGFLAFGSLVSAIGFSTLQERVFKISGFSYGGWMTIMTYTSFVACALFERILTGDSKRRSSLKDFAIVSLLTLSGLYLTNTSLKYLDYSTRVIFKSSKVIPTMAFGVLVLGRNYSWQQYCAAVLLVSGITFFTLGDKELSPKFSVIGVGLISVALVCDGLTGNMEEKLFFRKQDPCTDAEVILYTSFFSLFGGLIVATVTGELLPAINHSLQHIETVPFIFAFSCLGYISISFTLNLIQHFDATTAEIVKSLRKVLQVVMSFVVFGKSVNTKIVVGGGLVAIAIFWFQRCAQAKSRMAAKEEQRPAPGGDEALPLSTAPDAALEYNSPPPGRN